MVGSEENLFPIGGHASMGGGVRISRDSDRAFRCNRLLASLRGRKTLDTTSDRQRASPKAEAAIRRAFAMIVSIGGAAGRRYNRKLSAIEASIARGPVPSGKDAA
jgi:hypothetical protein